MSGIGKQRKRSCSQAEDDLRNDVRNIQRNTNRKSPRVVRYGMTGAVIVLVMSHRSFLDYVAKVPKQDNLTGRS